MNLITERWIPVRRASGVRERITPADLTANYASDPILSLAAPRPDFNGALIQFLIGLFQTAAAPLSEDAWEDALAAPPSTEALKELFAPLVPYFELFGDGARFMQDIDLPNGERKEIGSLLIEAPGDNTLENNTDHFIKRGGVTGMCPPCAATALFTMQTNAPGGGLGHRTSLRGAGPMTTLVLGETLWATVWLNVLNASTFSDSEKTADTDRFPWLSPTRTSDQGGVETTPVDVHPLQMYWAMPRRIRLDTHYVVVGECDICGARSEELILRYTTRNYGVSYKGAWRHPLSPYSVDKDGKPLARHPQPGGMGYRHWLGLVQTDPASKQEPAAVVLAFHKRSATREIPFRLWAFGYDIAKLMKARCWYEGTMPLFAVPSDDLVREIATLIAGAREVASNLRSNIKKAWTKRPADIKGDTSFIDAEFWSGTESEFYRHLYALRDLIADGEDTLPIRLTWHTTLCKVALQIFDRYAASGPIEHGDPKRIALARNDLKTWNHGKKVTELLGFAPPSSKKNQKTVSA